MWRVSRPVASMATLLRLGSSLRALASSTTARSRRPKAPLFEPLRCVAQRRIVRDSRQLKHCAQITRVLQDRDNAAQVRAKELSEHEHREQLMLRVELRTVLVAVRRQ